MLAAWQIAPHDGTRRLGQAGRKGVVDPNEAVANELVDLRVVQRARIGRHDDLSMSRPARIVRSLRNRLGRSVGNPQAALAGRNASAAEAPCAQPRKKTDAMLRVQIIMAARIYAPDRRHSSGRQKRPTRRETAHHPPRNKRAASLRLRLYSSR
ncbi:hypothetical protein [Bradyrhizobium sp. RDT46]|uniref:hypothetical protein n=1 Tax=Bradyrhizobium sp. RDT46 TaxID=3341829 RepID=UPI0035C6A7EA